MLEEEGEYVEALYTLLENQCIQIKEIAEDSEIIFELTKKGQDLYKKMKDS